MKIGKDMKWFVLAALFLTLSFAETGSNAAEKKPSRGSETMENVRIAVFSGTITALLYVAEDRGFFERHGLKASFTLYEAGITALEDLAAGKIDISCMMEFPLAVGRVKMDDLRIISSVASTNNLELITGRDRGIRQPSDLRGKRIGVMRGTFGEFFLAVFLTLNGIHAADVETVDLKPSEMEEAMIRGAVDGVIVWQPFVHDIKKRMGEKVVSWPAQGFQDSYALLVAKEAYIRNRPAVIEGLLRALLDAQDYVRDHTPDAQNIIKRRFGYETPFLLVLWSQNRLEVKLPQDLLILMEDEARWAIRNKMSPAQKTPNFLNNIYLDALKKIRPEAVTVIH